MLLEYRDILKIAPVDYGDDLGVARREIASQRLPRFRYERCGDGLSPTADGPAQHGLEVGYITQSGNVMSMVVNVKAVARSDVPLLTAWEQVSSCKSCKGSSGGCPGFAPRYDSLKLSLNTLVVITLTMDMAWGIKYSAPTHAGSRILYPMQYVDRLTDFYCARLLKALKPMYYTLSMGSCKGCRPSRCTVTRGRLCKYPKLRTFSMESVGIDCDALHVQFYHEFLPWYYQGTKKLQTYMTRYAGVLCDGGDVDDIIDTVREFILDDKSYISDIYYPDDAMTVSPMEIPSGVYKGYTQMVYNIPTKQV